jgi:hypothetical protein
MAGFHLNAGISARSTADRLAKDFLQLVDGGMENPVYITHAGDNSGRLFVVEQLGRIRILETAISAKPSEYQRPGALPSSGGGGEEGL